MPAPEGVVHVYSVPAGSVPFVPSTGVKLKLLPLQIVVLNVLIVAAGLIVTVTVKAFPVPQFNDEGVTR